MSQKESNISQQLLRELATAWTNAPELRLMQLLVNVVEPTSSVSELFHLEDSILLKRLQWLNDHDGDFCALHKLAPSDVEEGDISDAKRRLVLNAFKRLADTLLFSDQSRAQLLELTFAQYEQCIIAPEKHYAKHYARHHNTFLLFLRMGQRLYAISGADEGFMRHWFSTENSALDGAPKTLCCDISGLESVVKYLDTMKNKC